MKIIYSLYCLLGIMLYQGEAQAYSLDNSLDLNDKQISNDGASYQKIASVNFINRIISHVNKDKHEDSDIDDEDPIKKTDCPEGKEKVNGVCIDIDACKDAFPLTSANKKVGSYATRNCGSKGTRYCYTSCATGYTHDGCECKAVDCSGFPFSESKGHHCNGIKSCKTGDTFKYKCTACETGYELSGTVCNNKACASGYYSSVTSNCAKVEAAKTGEDLCYKCTECKQGWTLNTENYTCTENSCGTGYTTSMISNCVSYESVAKTGANICYKCKTCADGYSLNTTGTACEANSCQTGFSKTRSLYQCTSASAHMAGTDICKKCNSCSEYHGLNDSNECYDCTWSNYSHMDACPTGCSCTASEACGGHTKYRVDSANNYYKREDANDPAKGCVLCTEADDWGAGFVYESNCPSNCHCNYNKACGVTKRTTPDYANNYYKFVNSNNHEEGCTECTNDTDWDGYSSESCASGCVCSSKYACGVTKYSAPVDYQYNYKWSKMNVSCTACTAKDWSESDGYVLESCPTGCNCGGMTCGHHTKYKVGGTWKDYKYKNSSNHNEGCTACTNADWSNYTAETCPSHCNCSSATCGSHTKYSAPSSAKTGYTLSNGTCSATDCSAYPHSGTSNCSNYSSCNSAGTVTYKCTACNDGYQINNGACTAKSCPTSYAKDSTKCNNCASGACQTAKAGEDTCYFCASCADGYTQDGNGGCKVAYKYCGEIEKSAAWQKTNAYCSSYDTMSTSVDGTCYKCKQCNTNYTLEGGRCRKKDAYDCIGKGYSKLGIYYCVSKSTCKGNGETLEKCDTCSSTTGVAKRAVTSGGKTVYICAKACSGGYDPGGTCRAVSSWQNDLAKELSSYGY